SGLEDALDVALRVIADTSRRDIGNPAVAAFGIGAAGKALPRDNGAEKVAGTVALRAMPRAAHQVGAAIPLFRFGGIRLERLAVEKKKFSAAGQAAGL